MSELNTSNKPPAVASPLVAKELRKHAEYGLIRQVADGILCVLADNPKDYTGPGTNTYVIGEEAVWILDPGPNSQKHIDAVLAAVNGRGVEGILVTHTHLDHSPAANPLKEITGAKTYGFGALSKDILALTDEDIDEDFVPDEALSHGQMLGEGDYRIEALHTPGHFPNHMCYRLWNKDVLFSGDHVMGWSTTVVVPPLGHLGEYLQSLNVLEACEASLMLPSHGDPVDNPNGRIHEVREHRMMRHAQVADCMAEGLKCPEKIVEKLYVDLTPRLIEAAKGCVQAHIELLEEEATMRAPVKESFAFDVVAP
ncbi:MBL fold metallo-hydrolase [Kordiimonas sp. SCSIO 12603]|uniref:MBL fold metallo-hydrolase n=1 Tax=Kordiimonas sp. SCSIO 12603 TaxID=2829596 RepID=UPI0021032542|nr:MBL fold metallo-hydrolase [Kordiimonas sp. SCSIO 12603]UTW59636.1 MBL fold metallo-hydrolase [Kordiimonas sp. SCSIO 12603]